MTAMDCFVGWLLAMTKPMRRLDMPGHLGRAGRHRRALRRRAPDGIAGAGLELCPAVEFNRTQVATVPDMIFRQLFDSVSGTYSYLLASRAGGEALILDPVLEKVDRYCQLLRELDLKLVKAVDTHLPADHVTGLGELRDRTHCVTILGEPHQADLA